MTTLTFAAVVSHILSYLQDAAVEAGKEVPKEGLKALWHRLKPLKHLYFRFQYFVDLRRRLSGMPFLYKELNLHVDSDFVDSQIRQVDPDEPFSKAEANFLTLEVLHQFRAFRKLILLGGGGMGKTTTFRYLALSIVERQKLSDVFGNARGIVPVFVALKTIDAYGKTPVLDAIRESTPYFRGKLGQWRLKRTAKKGNLLLLLDGYDETPRFDDKAALHGELSYLFDERRTHSEGVRANRELYDALRGCRIYLSSRHHFYRMNRFQISKNITHWTILHIDKAKARLVQRVFDHYIGINQAYADVLDPEQFMYKLNLARDRGFLELAGNPLFFTIIIYVYIKDIKLDDAEHRQIGRLFQGSAYALFSDCIDLMLVGIDEAKLSNMGERKRAIYLRRRAMFPHDRRLFLAYLAHEATLMDTNVFSRHQLVAIAKRFFATSESPNRLDILQSLESDSPDINFMDSILESGILVDIGVKEGFIQYDFPHRRFRETLAEELTVERFLSGHWHPDEVGTHDILISYSRRSPDSWRSIADRTAILACGEPSSKSMWGLIGRLFETGSVNQARLFRRRLVNCVTAIGMQSEVSATALEILRATGNDVLSIAVQFDVSLEAKDLRSCAICALLLRDNVDRPRMERSLIKGVSSGHVGVDFVASMLPLVGSDTGMELCGLLIDVSENESDVERALATICRARIMSEGQTVRNVLRSRIKNRLDARLSRFASAFEPQVFGEWIANFTSRAETDSEKRAFQIAPSLASTARDFIVS